jgi:radical SAM protein with 4Fe4S-binding SPASM domain
MEVVYNIRYFQRIKDEHGFDCKTTVAGCISPENKDDIDKIQEYWEARVDHIFFRPEETFVIPQLMPELLNDGRTFNCKHLYEYLSVDWDGQVVLCCRDIYAQYRFGNVTIHDPLDLFNGNGMNELRNMMRYGRNYPTICDYCGTPSKREIGEEQLAWLDRLRKQSV